MTQTLHTTLLIIGGGPGGYVAAIRAGLVVAPIPLLWRQSELNDALNRVRARSFITATRINGVDHAELAMNAAAATFSIRHVGAFGGDTPDGIGPLDDILRQTATHHALPKWLWPVTFLHEQSIAHLAVKTATGAQETTSA